MVFRTNCSRNIQHIIVFAVEFRSQIAQPHENGTRAHILLHFDAIYLGCASHLVWSHVCSLLPLRCANNQRVPSRATIYLSTRAVCHQSRLPTQGMRINICAICAYVFAQAVASLFSTYPPVYGAFLHLFFWLYVCSNNLICAACVCVCDAVLPRLGANPIYLRQPFG